MKRTFSQALSNALAIMVSVLAWPQRVAVRSLRVVVRKVASAYLPNEALP